MKKRRMFKIQKKYMLGLGNWLGGLALNGKQSRARTRFIQLLQDALNRVETDRRQMIEEICERDDNDQCKIVEEDGKSNYVIPDDKKESFAKDLTDLYEENAELTGPETTTVFQTVKDIVLNYDKEIDPAIAASYDEWCKAFEAWEV